MEYHMDFAGPVITLFLTGMTGTGAFSCLNTLVIDINIESPAAAVAANNLFRRLFGAGAITAAIPIIDRIGFGWTGALVACILFMFNPILWAVMK